MNILKTEERSVVVNIKGYPKAPEIYQAGRVFGNVTEAKPFGSPKPRGLPQGYNGRNAGKNKSWQERLNLIISYFI